MGQRLGGYNMLAIEARDDGTVALDFTGKGDPGPFLTLNAMQWLALQRAVRSMPASR